MSMPPQSPLLIFDCEPVGITPSWLDRALCHTIRSICPWISQLSDSMPDKFRHNNWTGVETCMYVYAILSFLFLIILRSYNMFHNYQWRVTLYLALFIALITRVSPSRTSSVGPGNSPLTVIVLWVLHSLLTGLAWICFNPHKKKRKLLLCFILTHTTERR